MFFFEKKKTAKKLRLASRISNSYSICELHSLAFIQIQITYKFDETRVKKDLVRTILFKSNKRLKLTLREKRPYSEFFSSVFSRIRTESLRIRTLFT